MSTLPEIPAKEVRPPTITDIQWYAGLAMQAIISKQPTVPDTQVEREEISLWAYRMAQAMLATEKRIRIE
ncbi:MAG: hypothetical protein R3E01_01175 [Pirellulaceae bacterium]